MLLTSSNTNSVIPNRSHQAFSKHSEVSSQITSTPDIPTVYGVTVL
jgi:hypothetical protein